MIPTYILRLALAWKCGSAEVTRALVFLSFSAIIFLRLKSTIVIVAALSSLSMLQTLSIFPIFLIWKAKYLSFFFTSLMTLLPPETLGGNYHFLVNFSSFKAIFFIFEKIRLWWVWSRKISYRLKNEAIKLFHLPRKIFSNFVFHALLISRSFYCFYFRIKICVYKTWNKK